jgi:hypothetical protein
MTTPDGTQYLRFGRYAVFCPANGETLDEIRMEFEERGRLVVVIEPAQDIATQLDGYSFWKP